MSSKDSFREFVRKNPSLSNYVNNNSMTWQKFYEMFDLYGEDSSVWDKYLKESSSFELLNWLKSIDIDAVQENIKSVRRVLSVFEDLGKKEDSEVSSYQPRPLYRHFED